MEAVALVIVSAVALWLMAAGFLMALRPAYCVHLMAKMTTNLEASNWRLQFTEQGLRVVAGLALIARSPTSKLPATFEIAGWILVVTSVVIMVLPIGWHGKYGAFVTKPLTAAVIRLLSPIPVLVGPGLIYAAI